MSLKNKFRILFGLLASGLLSLSLGLIIQSSASATTPTYYEWTGGDSGASGNGGCTADCWSIYGNWEISSDGGNSYTAATSGEIPGSSSDDVVVFPNTALESATPEDDISSLSISSLEFIGNNSGESGSIQLNDPITITSSISQDSTDTNTTDIIGNAGTAETITLGGDVTVNSSDGISFGGSSPVDNIALGGNSLTFDANNDTSQDIAVNDNITGSGSVVYNGSNISFDIDGSNTYSGTTTIEASDLWVGNILAPTNPFGTSAITVDEAGGLLLTSGTSQTISNDITVAGAPSGDGVTSIEFINTTDPNSAITVAVPNITVDGNTVFGNVDGQETVNLAGINASGNCIEYIGDGGGSDASINGPANGFINGPPACIVDSGSTSAPGTPDTGSGLTSDRVAIPLLGSIASVTGLLLIYRVTRRSSAK